MSTQELENQIQKLSKMDESSRDYQIVLANIKASASALLGGTSTKLYPSQSEIETSVVNAILDCKNPEIEMSDYFKEYDGFLDSTVYKEVVQAQVKYHFRDYCNKSCMSFIYSKLLLRVNTLRKLRTALELFQYILNLQAVIADLRTDVAESSNYPFKLLVENTRLKNELENIYEVYTSDDEEIDKYFKYKKLKTDGCSDQEVAKIFGVARTTLLKIVRGYASE